MSERPASPDTPLAGPSPVQAGDHDGAAPADRSDEPPATSLRDAARALLCGMAMGTSDAVPGVSGGTIALILGIYDRLITSIAMVLQVGRHPGRADVRRRGLWALAFLVPLGVGMLTALYLALKLLVGHKPDDVDAATMVARGDELDGLLLNPQTAPYVFAAFFGLVLGSLPQPWCRRRAARFAHWPVALLGAGLSATVALLPSLGAAPGPVLFILSGALAISVMLLPGISGSLALLVIGMYQPISQAVTDRDVGIIALVGGGAVIGLILFIPLLRRLLLHVHDGVMAFLTGLMAGSLVALWPWKTHYLPDAIPVVGPMQPVAPSGAWWWALVACLLGAALVPVATAWARRRQGRRDGAAS